MLMVAVELTYTTLPSTKIMAIILAILLISWGIFMIKALVSKVDKGEITKQLDIVSENPNNI